MGARTRRPGSSTLAVLAVVPLLVPAAASADTACSYNAPTQTLGVGGDPQSGSALDIANNGTDILVYHLFPGGSSLVGCANGQATTTNTDTITVNHQQLGDSDRIAIMDPKSFAPGATDEQVGVLPLADEIEIELTLGTGEDELTLLPGNPASHDDTFVLGRDGLNWNPGDVIDDVDVVTEDFPPISSYRVSLGSGDNTFTAQGGFGTGDPILNPMVITGGDVLGTDSITGGDGDDEIDGRGAADVLRGAGGNDEVVGGGGGGDRMLGNGGNDDLLAKDGKRDRRIDCGPGAADGAQRDKSKDPKPKSC